MSWALATLPLEFRNSTADVEPRVIVPTKALVIARVMTLMLSDADGPRSRRSPSIRPSFREKYRLSARIVAPLESVTLPSIMAHW